jgi:outer membrane protein assembly factor BamB
MMIRISLRVVLVATVTLASGTGLVACQNNPSARKPVAEACRSLETWDTERGFVAAPPWTSPRPERGTRLPASHDGWARRSVVSEGMRYTLTDDRTLVASSMAGASQWTLPLPELDGPIEPVGVMLIAWPGQIAVRREFGSEQPRWKQLDVVDVAGRRVAWSHRWPDSLGVTHYPAQLGSVVVAQVADGSPGLVGLDRLTGRPRWTQKGISWPEVRLGLLLVSRLSPGETAAERIDPESGRVLWHHAAPKRDKDEALVAVMRSEEFVIGSTAYFASMSELAAVDANTGKALWRVHLGLQEMWRAFPGDGSAIALFGKASTGAVTVLFVDSGTGAIQDTVPIGGEFAEAWGLRCEGKALVMVLPDDGRLSLLGGAGNQIASRDGLWLNLAHSNIALDGDTLFHLDTTSRSLVAIRVPQLTDLWRVEVDESMSLIDEVSPPQVILSDLDSSKITYAPAGK